MMRSDTPLVVGLVGAGGVHAPVFAHGPETRLGGVWARDPAKAQELAAASDSRAFSSYEELVEACQAIVFAVPPAVQADLAPLAARAGRALLLEKPLGESAEQASRLAAEVEAAGVPHMVAFTYRFVPEVRRLLAGLEGAEPLGARACFFTGSLRGGPFAQGWRLVHGSLLDLGAHVVDLLEAALGPVEEAEAFADGDFTAALLRHRGGGVSNLAVCSTAEVDGSRIELEVLAGDRQLRVDVTAATRASTPGSSRLGGPLADPTVPPFSEMRTALVDCALSGRSHELDCTRALAVQRTLALIGAARRNAGPRVVNKA
jgi:predicted dehydrogenase